MQTRRPHTTGSQFLPARLAGARIRIVALCLFSGVLLCGVLAGGSAVAEDSWGYDIAHELMSPYCPGRTLATCPSPQAAELVQWIVMQEAAGVSQDQVIEMLVERFGEDILGAPPAEGMTLWAYIFPVLGFLVGGGAAFLVLRKIVAGGGSSASPTTIPTAALASAESLAVPRAPDSPQALDGPPKHDDDDFDDADLARIVDGDLDLRA